MGILKKILIVKIIFLAVAYLCCFIGIPYVLNKNDYSKIVTEKIKKETGLILIIHKYNLAVSPTLNITAKADDIQLFYPDKKQILNIRNADIEISTLNLIFKELKINKFKSDEIQFSTKLLKSGKTTFQEYLEKKITTKSPENEFKFSQKLPIINVKKYIVKIKDEESGQKFKVSGNSFKIKQNFNPKDIDLITNGSFYCNNKKYADYNLKIIVPKILFKDLNKKLFDISADNFSKYSFYAQIKANVKIHEKNEKFDALSGKIDIDKFTIKIGNKKLPPSFFHILMNNNKANISSKFYTDINEITDITAVIKMKKPYEISMKCICPKANISNLQQLTISLLEILKIKNNLSEFQTNGLLSANFELNTDLKTIHSNGILNIKNANLSHKNIPLKITNTFADIDFSNNEIKIKKCDAKVNNQQIKLSGTVDKNAYGNIVLNAQNLDLNHIMNAFPALKPQKNMVINSGQLSLTAKLKGKLDKAMPQINAEIKNFKAQENKLHLKFSIEQILITAKTNSKNYEGNIHVKNVTVFQSNIANISNKIKTSEIIANFDQNNIVLQPTKVNLGNAKLIIKGLIKNYLDTPNTSITASGTIDTDLIKSFIPQKDRNKFYNKGYIPIKIEIKKIKEITDFDVELLANPNNYITPLHVNNFKGTNTLTIIKAQLNKDILNIKKINIYKASGVTNLLNKIDYSKLKKHIKIEGKIKNINQTAPILENFHIQVLENINVTIPDYINSKMDINSDLYLNGNVDKPVINGYLNIYNLSIPQYLITARSICTNFDKNIVTTQINNFKLKSMDISIDSIAPIDFLKTNKINYLKLSSNYLNIDYLLELMPLMKESKYTPGNEFPFNIDSGKIFIKTCKIGDIKAENITADITADKHNFYIKNLFSDTYNGKTAGKITYNFPYMSTKAELQGRNLNASAAALALLPKDQRITGKLNFDATLTMYGSNFKQQMKTLKGQANVLINHGHMGQLGRFEHFLYAQNLLSQRLIYASLNSAKQAISPKDTGNITYLKGILKFNNGYMYLSPVTTAGPQMSMYITGNINMFNNEADLEILGKISSEVSSSMGLLGKMTIKEFLDEHTKYGQTIANLFNFCNSELPEMDISKIPELSPNYKYQTKNFRVIISGNTESVKAVKSFTWINPIGTKQKILTEKIHQTINEVIPQSTTQKEQKQNTNTLNNTQQIPKVESRPMQIQKPTTPDFLNDIPDKFSN